MPEFKPGEGSQVDALEQAEQAEKEAAIRLKKAAEQDAANKKHAQDEAAKEAAEHKGKHK